MLRHVLLLALLLAPPALSADGLDRAPEPGWVIELPIPEMDPALAGDIYGGRADLLTDTQIAWQDGKRLTWWRHVITATDRSGLEGSGTLTYEFDPYYDHVSLSRLRIIRQGKVIDLLDQVIVDTYRRELGLESGIVDGALTAVIEIPDLRIGDLVDYAFLSESSAVLPGAEYSISSDLEYGVPIGLVHARVLWPKGVPFFEGPMPPHVERSTRFGPDVTEHVWRIANAAPVSLEEMSAPGVSAGAWLQLGSYPNWAPIANGFAPYYLAEYELTPEWEAEVEAIRRASNDPSVQIIAALRLVQDRIRYVGVEVGEGGYYARKPAEVIAKGYGDCKDKALLFRTIADRLGIKVEAVLADIDGWIGGGEIPTLFLFDHMIARAYVDGQWHYMDPTMSHQGGTLETAARPDYGWVLPLSTAKDQGLERIETSLRDGWVSDSLETYRFNFLGMFLTVSTTFRGAAADSWRYDWGSGAKTAFASQFHSYYTESYPGLTQTTPPVFEDDREANVIKIHENYYLTNQQVQDAEFMTSFILKAGDPSANFSAPGSSPRQTPLWLGGHRDQHWRVEVKNAPIWFEPPEPVTIITPAFGYGFLGTATEDGNMELDWRFQTAERWISPDEADEVLARAAEITDTTSWTWDLSPLEE